MDQGTRDQFVAEAFVESTGDAVLTPEMSRKVRRKHRKRSRSKTIAPKRLTKEEIRLARMLPIIDQFDRPQTREACLEGQRPCPYVSCKHHLYLDVNPETGSIKVNFPNREVWEMTDTCSLDVADRGGITLEEVGAILNLTRERIRQVEVRGLLKLKTVGPGEEPIPGDPNWVPIVRDHVGASKRFKAD
jgi:hypothetical protein